MFDQCLKKGDGESAGIQIQIRDKETVDICRGYTHTILGHPCAHVTNMSAKYLDLNTMHHEEIYES